MSTHKRKLAAVMFTDIVGFSGMMSRDESRAHALLLEHNRIVEDAVVRHSGRILKTMGDAFFIEFDAAFNAVQCAVDIQTALKEYNLDKPADSKIFVRIGLHIGDVIVDGDDLYGEGVNVAARLQPLADPGGVCMSQAVYQAVKAHTPIEAVHVGEVELKNIIEKYVIYKIPSPYTSEIEWTEKPQILTSKQKVIDFRIKRIENLPSTSKTFIEMLSIWAAVDILFMTILIIGCSIMSLYRAPGRLLIGDLMDATQLAIKIKSDADPLSEYIHSRMTTKNRRLLDAYNSDSLASEELKYVLFRELRY